MILILTPLRNNPIPNIFFTCLILWPLHMLKNKDPENKAGDLSQSKYSGGSVSWEEKKSYGLLQPVQFPLAVVLILLLISKKQFVLTTEHSCHYWNQKHIYEMQWHIQLSLPWPNFL